MEKSLTIHSMVSFFLNGTRLIDTTTVMRKMNIGTIMMFMVALTAFPALIFFSSPPPPFFIQSSYAQFQLTEEPTTMEPTTTTALGQSNSTSGGIEEDPTINSLIFMPDGTGLIRLDSNGTLSPLIPFNHNLTAANGYTIYDSAPFFADNGTKVDLNSIDFSSQITIDPSANVTLPAKPMISPSASSDVSSLPPSPSQIEAPPSTQAAPSPQQQQPGLSEPPTTATIPPLTAGTATDPELQRFDQIATDCRDTLTRVVPGKTTPEQLLFDFPSNAARTDLDKIESCNRLIAQAINQYCDNLQTYDAVKCAYVNTDPVWNFLDMSAILSEMRGMSIFNPDLR